MENFQSHLEVLLAEYQVIKAEQKSRAALQVQLIGFVFVAAGIATALLEPTLHNPNTTILLLALSIGFSLIGFLYLSISRFNQELIHYEYEVLRRKIQKCLEPTQGADENRGIRVLQWWGWYRSRLRQESMITKIVKASLLYTPMAFSLGLVILFLYFLPFQGRNLLQLSLLEVVFIIIAMLMIAVNFLAIVSAMRDYRFYDESPNIVVTTSDDDGVE